MYRITRTDFQSKGQRHAEWRGLCAVVELGEKLAFPNGVTTGVTTGVTYRYKRAGAELKILEGPHRGQYVCTRIE